VISAAELAASVIPALGPTCLFNPCWVSFESITQRQRQWNSKENQNELSHVRPVLRSRDRMSQDTELLREIRDLLLVIAEPDLAKRDEKRRQALRSIVGKSKARAKAVLLMDGARTQSDIKAETGIDPGDLSRCVKALRETSLIEKDDRHPKLVIRLQPNFFDVD
jgi:hypothetical protein